MAEIWPSLYQYIAIGSKYFEKQWCDIYLNDVPIYDAVCKTTIAYDTCPDRVLWTAYILDILCEVKLWLQ